MAPSHTKISNQFCGYCVSSSKSVVTYSVRILFPHLFLKGNLTDTLMFLGKKKFDTNYAEFHFVCLLYETRKKKKTQHCTFCLSTCFVQTWHISKQQYGRLRWINESKGLKKEQMDLYSFPFFKVVVHCTVASKVSLKVLDVLYLWSLISRLQLPLL